MKTYCGIDCCKDCDKLSECGGCEKCQGIPLAATALQKEIRFF